MSERPERRWPRQAIAWTVEISADRWRDMLPLTATNMSRGGLFVRSARPPAPGSRIHVLLRLPDETMLDLTAEVVHAAGPEGGAATPGFGVKVDERHVADLTLLEAMVASQAGRAPPGEDPDVTLQAFLMSIAAGHMEPTSAHGRLDAAEVALVTSAPPVADTDVDVGDDAIFGIDLGTSYCSIAVLARGRMCVLEDDEGNALFPSIVCYPESGAPLTGWPAREKLVTHPSTTVTSPKRLLGRKFADRQLEPYLAALAVRTREGPGGQVLADIYGEPVAIPQVCAEIFRSLAAVAEARTGRRPERVVLSAPVGYGEEKQAIQRAAELAGLKVLAVIEEPMAAALAYGLGRQLEHKVAVYDFGGGTFDFTILDIHGSRFDVLGMAGDAWLGGDDFDLEMAEHIANAFWRRTKVDLRHRLVEWQRLRFLCEAAKRKLTTLDRAEILARGIAISVRGPIDLKITVTRETFERLCAKLVHRSLATVAECLEKAGVAPTAVDRVVMIGGVSRIPLVIDKVRAYFQRDIHFTVNPEQAIVAGNAIYGAMLARAKKARTP